MRRRHLGEEHSRQADEQFEEQRESRWDRSKWAGGGTWGMETEVSAGVEPQGLGSALRGLDFILNLMGRLCGVLSRVVT